jgi:hypothetical protein
VALESQNVRRLFGNESGIIEFGSIGSLKKRADSLFLRLRTRRQNPVQPQIDCGRAVVIGQTAG